MAGEWASGVGGFLQGAQDAYWKQKQYDLQLANQDSEKKQLAARLAAEGFEYDPNGALVRTKESSRQRNLQEATTQAGILKAGYKAEEDPTTGKFNLTKVPGFHDVEEENKQLQNARLKRDLIEGKKPSASEFAASGYAKRLEDAEGVFGDIAKGGYDPSGASSALQKSAIFPGFLQSENVKKEEQAKRNFVNAILRRESGAAISSGEFESANKQYFPEPNDPSSLVKQKEVNRRLAIENLKAEGSRAYSKSPGVEEIKGLLGPAVSTKKPNSALGGLLNSARADTGEDKVSSFMKKNGITSRDEAIQILKEHGKL